MPGHVLDVCECGDYRHQHVDGKGRCKLGGLCTPTPCQQFRLAYYYRAHAKDECVPKVVAHKFEDVTYKKKARGK